jgi:hypothetical protein
MESDPVALRNDLGGRWLTADFKVGDILIKLLYLFSRRIVMENVTPICREQYYRVGIVRLQRGRNKTDNRREPRGRNGEKANLSFAR